MHFRPAPLQPLSLLPSPSPGFPDQLCHCPSAQLQSWTLPQYMGMGWTGKGISTRYEIFLSLFFSNILFFLILLTSTAYQPNLCLHLIWASSQQTARHSKHHKPADSLEIWHYMPSRAHQPYHTSSQADLGTGLCYYGPVALPSKPCCLSPPHCRSTGAVRNVISVPQWWANSSFLNQWCA